MRSFPSSALLLGVASGLLAACGDTGTAPAISISTVLVDGRTCRDASVVTIELDFGQQKPPRFPCVDTAAPKAVTAEGLPLSDEVAVRGLSVQGAELYRGSLVPSEALDGPMPAVTVTLYPSAAR